MKILIDNRTKLNNEEIGYIIDTLQKREKGSTQYCGKWKGYELENRIGEKLKIETLVMKRYLKILIMEENNEEQM
jgi:hypothetical protein